MSPNVFDQYVALVVFTVTAAFTPGPNNVMLLASGVNFGFRRTLPHIAGIVVGHPVMAAIIAWGLGTVFRSHPWMHQAIEAVGVVYLVWLAQRIAFQPVSSGIDAGVVRTAEPLGFWPAVGFQWVNVKGWVAAISAAAVYVPETFSPSEGALFLFSVFFPVALLATSAWTGLGAAIARFLHDRLRLRLFNLTMGGLLVVSIWPAFVDLWLWMRF